MKDREAIAIVLFLIFVLAVGLAVICLYVFDPAPCYYRHRRPKTKEEKAEDAKRRRRTFWFWSMKLFEVGFPIACVITTICQFAKVKAFLISLDITTSWLPYIAAAVYGFFCVTGAVIVFIAAIAILMVVWKALKIIGKLVKNFLILFKDGVTPAFVKMGQGFMFLGEKTEKGLVAWINGNYKRAEEIAEAGSILNYLREGPKCIKEDEEKVRKLKEEKTNEMSNL